MHLESADGGGGGIGGGRLAALPGVNRMPPRTAQSKPAFIHGAIPVLVCGPPPPACELREHSQAHLGWLLPIHEKWICLSSTPVDDEAHVGVVDRGLAVVGIAPEAKGALPPPERIDQRLHMHIVCVYVCV